MKKAVFAVATAIAMSFALTACNLSTSLVGQPEALCKAARNAGARIEDWKPYGAGYGYACVSDEEFIGGEGGSLGLYTKVGVQIIGADESRMDHIDLYVDLGNPDTATQGVELLARRVKAFFASIGAPIPAGLLDAIKSRAEYAFQTPLGQGQVFVDDGRVPGVVVQIVRMGIPFNRRM